MDREWTDKRTDDFADRVGRFEANVDQRFDKVDARFDRFEGDVKDRFDKVDQRFDRLEAEVKVGFASAAAESKAASAKLDTRMEAMNHTIWVGNRTIWAGIIVVGISKFLFG